MAAKETNTYLLDLRLLLDQALAGAAAPLAQYLARGSGLPGPRMNLALVGALAAAAAASDAGFAFLDHLAASSDSDL